MLLDSCLLELASNFSNFVCCSTSNSLASLLGRLRHVLLLGLLHSSGLLGQLLGEGDEVRGTRKVFSQRLRDFQALHLMLAHIQLPSMCHGVLTSSVWKFSKMQHRARVVAQSVELRQCT